jgi:hypothetical protein
LGPKTNFGGILLEAASGATVELVAALAVARITSCFTVMKIFTCVFINLFCEFGLL